MENNFTFGLTAFNAQDSIIRAVKSALACNPSCVIVCDDGSTDRTRVLLEKYAKREKRLQLEFNPSNIGVAASRNRLITCCKTSYLAFLDDDDEAMTHRLLHQHRTYISTCQKLGHNRVLVYGARFLEDENRVLHGLGVDQVISGAALFLYASLGLRRGNFHPGLIGTGTLFSHVDTLRSLGGFDEALRRNEDIELVMRAGLSGCSCVSTPKMILKQHQTEGVEKSAFFEFRMRNSILRKHWFNLLKLWPLLPLAYFTQSLALAFKTTSPVAKRSLRAVSFIFMSPIDTVKHCLALRRKKDSPPW